MKVLLKLVLSVAAVAALISIIGGTMKKPESSTTQATQSRPVMLAGEGGV